MKYFFIALAIFVLIWCILQDTPAQKQAKDFIRTEQNDY
jgi:hypothetical protein